MNDQTKESDNLYIYRIDSNDDITYVSDNLSIFAEENKATSQCTNPLVLGRSLWEFISDPETRHLYKLILGQVRAKQKSVQLPINCDSPNIKRYIEITINPQDNDAIEFLSKIIKLTQRDAVTILDDTIERSDEILKICSFCKNIAVSANEWVETQHAIEILDLFGSKKMPQLSHGVCPSCAEIILKDLEPYS